MTTTFSTSIASELGAVNALLRELAPTLAHTPLSSSCRFDIRLILEELLTNVVKYADAGRTKDSITVRLNEQAGTVTIEVTDNGDEFNPLKHPEPDTDADISELQVGGLGLYLVRHLSQHVEYSRCNGRNVVTVNVSDNEPEEAGS